MDDGEMLRRLARMAVGFAEVHELPAGVLYGEGPDDLAGLIPLLVAAFNLGRSRRIPDLPTVQERPEPVQ